MTDSTSAAPAAFDAQAAGYEAPRRRLIPPFDAFYGTAVAALEMLGRPPPRVLDLGAGSG
ncbi:MAG: tRNA (cmo5U34)-methyltransferase, partial [Baekduia sp.]|nr:tRNA (cmo5U34)-methyltransferase [Baekduia sp.]